ncbi:DUF5615 family PIN-like protein [Gillisia sp. Q332]|uniref:DUF5615 family PIN-like protein n=1 Tax=Gillisia xinjiangensis TaxID=3384765 RepID=UPI003919DB18
MTKISPFGFFEKLKFNILKQKQVKELNLENSTDLQIWEYARVNYFTIVTFDADFFDIANLKGHPPKIIWLRTGNTTTINLEKLFIDKRELIADFILNPVLKNIACLEID